jgi:vacuolar-type H+-ATPase subunit D/Vma8
MVGGAALEPAAAAHRRAVEAAARYAAARSSHRRVAAELALTARRLRTIERRWLPEHERALVELELRLDEEEREESGRIRWAAERDDSRRG